MHGVVSLLPSPHYDWVEALWDELEAKHGMKGIRITPFPHFSWQIGEAYDFSALKTCLESIAASQPPFKVRTTGLGQFTGEHPVLFIPVVKSPELVNFHQRVWQALLPITTGASPYYSPENWIPHISIGYEDLNTQNIGAVMQELAFRTFNWEFEVDNLSFIYEPSGFTGTLQVTIPLQRS